MSSEPTTQTSTPKRASASNNDVPENPVKSAFAACANLNKDAHKLLQAKLVILEVFSKYDLSAEDKIAIEQVSESLDNVASSIQTNAKVLTPGPNKESTPREPALQPAKSPALIDLEDYNRDATITRKRPRTSLSSIPQPVNGTMFECEEAMGQLVNAPAAGAKAGVYISAWLAQDPRPIPVERRYCYELLKKYKEGKPVCWRKKTSGGKLPAVKQPAQVEVSSNEPTEAAAAASLQALSLQALPFAPTRKFEELKSPRRRKRVKDPEIPHPANGRLFSCQEAMKLLFVAPSKGATASDYIKAWLEEDPPLVPVSRRQCYILLQKYRFGKPVRWGVTALVDDTPYGQRLNPTAPGLPVGQPAPVPKAAPPKIYPIKKPVIPQPTNGKMFECEEAMRHLVDATSKGATASDYIKAWLGHSPPLMPVQRRHCYNLLKRFKEGDPVAHWGLKESSAKKQKTGKNSIDEATVVATTI